MIIKNFRDSILYVFACAWCGAIYFSYSWKALYSDLPSAMVVTTANLTHFSEKLTWIPIVLEVMNGQIFPLSTTLSVSTNGFTYYPYFSLWLLAAIAWLFGLNNAVFFAQVIAPTLVFLVSILLYRRYVSRSWAVLLAALGIVAYSGYPLREFINGLLYGTMYSELGSTTTPDLAGVPIPSLSVLIFLVTLASTLSIRRISKLALLIMSVVWGAQIYVHPVNALFGLPFWFFFVAIRLYREKRFNRIRDGLAQVTWPILITVLVATPSFYQYVTTIIIGGFMPGTPHNPGIVHSSLYSFAVHIALPCVTILAMAAARRVDPFEIFIKFWPVFLFMAIELLFMIAARYIIPIEAVEDMVFTRLGMSVLHMFYFLPAIYYAAQRGLNENYSLGPESNRISFAIRNVVNRVYTPLSLVILAVTLTILTLYSFLSIQRFRETAVTPSLSEVAQVRSDLAFLETQLNGQQVKVIASNVGLAFNMHLIKQGTLFNNRFSNQLTEEEMAFRIAVAARVLGWSTENLLKFINPSQSEGPASPQKLLDSTNGVGFWLVFNNSSLDERMQLRWRALVLEYFVNLDLAEAVKKLDIRYVYIRDELTSELSYIGKTPGPSGVLYKLSW